MKKLITIIIGLTISLIGKSQFIRASIQKNATYNNKVDIVFRPTYTSSSGEYIQYLQFSVSIPDSLASGVTASAVGVNTFSNMGTINQFPQYTQGSERVFTWYYTNTSGATQSWNTSDFIGAEINFSGGVSSSNVRMLDLTNTGSGGGDNLSTYFVIVSSAGDVTDYSGIYYSISGASTLGNYGTGDQYVETDSTVSLPLWVVDINTTTNDLYVDKFSLERLFPNPATSVIKMTLLSPVKDKVIVTVLNMQGITLIRQLYNIEIGNNTVPLDISALPVGAYTVKVSGSDKKTTLTRFIKQ
jgi:hypothetical protein